MKALVDLQSRLFDTTMRNCRNETQIEIASNVYMAAFDKLVLQTRTIHEGYFDGLKTISSPEAQATINNARQSSMDAFAKLEASYRRVVGTLKAKHIGMVKENTREAVEKMKVVQAAFKDAVAPLLV